MTGPINFYREVDLVEESVIPKQEGIVLSSDAKEASFASSKGSKKFAHKALQVIGDNELVDGISVRYPGYLADFFNKLRLKLIKVTDNVSKKVETKTSKFYAHETRIATRISRLHSDPREELLPGFTYVAVAAMTGSILTRNKNILLRLTTPLVLGSICFSYVLPSTFKNTTGLLHDMEAKSFPDAVARQDAVMSKTKSIACDTVQHVDNGVKYTASTLGRIQHLIKEWTGLNVE